MVPFQEDGQRGKAIMISLSFHKTLLRVFMKPLLMRIMLCCAVLSALLEVLALLEEASTILSRNLGFYGIFKYIFLHLPALIVEIMPLSVMIGSLFTLIQMTLSSEIAAMRAAGLSTFNMFKHLLPTPVFIGIITTLIQFWVVPPCEQELNLWWNETATSSHDQDGLKSLWFRDGSDIAHIDRISSGGRHLEGVIIYQRDSVNGLLQQTDHFSSLQFTSSGWKADKNSSKTTINRDQSKGETGYIDDKIALTASPRQIINMTLEGTFYTPFQIWKALTKEGPWNLPPSNYMMALFSGIFLPLQMVVMLLITLPVTYIPPRAGLRNPLPVYVMGAGLGIVILQGMISALGNAGSLPVVLAVSSGHIIAALLSLAWVLRMEEK